MRVRKIKYNIGGEMQGVGIVVEGETEAEDALLQSMAGNIARIGAALHNAGTLHYQVEIKAKVN